MVALRFKKFRIRKGKGKPRRRLLSVRPVPTLITLGNLLCGFGAMFLAMGVYQLETAPEVNRALYRAGILIFLAMLFDVLDGRIARLTKSTSRFGLEMDSLCDIVSFGVAPAVIIKATLDTLGPIYWVTLDAYPIPDRIVYPLLAVYICCAALRLARYNVETGPSHSDIFFGIPSPAAAGCIASLVVIITSYPAMKSTRSVYFDPVTVPPGFIEAILCTAPFLMLVLGILMVTRVRYVHMGDKLLGGRKSFMHLMIVALGLVLVYMQHEIMLVLAFNGYMISGLVNEVVCRFRKVDLEGVENRDAEPHNGQNPSTSNDVQVTSSEVTAIPYPLIDKGDSTSTTNTEVTESATP